MIQAVLVAISCVGWVTNHFVGTRFPGQSDISAAVGYVLLYPSSLGFVGDNKCTVRLPSAWLRIYMVVCSMEMLLSLW